MSGTVAQVNGAVGDTVGTSNGTSGSGNTPSNGTTSSSSSSSSAFVVLANLNRYQIDVSLTHSRTMAGAVAVVR